MVNKKALILFSGGLDSTTVLHHAITKGYVCIPLTIDYNQRHSYEIESSQKYLKNLKLKGHVFKIDLTQIGGSALTDKDINVPIEMNSGIPVTYVPARNTIFLSIASAYAEKMGIDQIFIGVNQIDYSGYPDCRPDFIDSFKTTINLGTKTGVDGKQLEINTPLINMSKKDIIKYGYEMGIDYSQTVSCYQLDNNGNACGHCDACKLRKEGFLLAELDDPTRYKN
jgi:7-cyano-7-deazaguanine synthase